MMIFRCRGSLDIVFSHSSCCGHLPTCLFASPLYPMQAMQEAMLLAPWPDAILQHAKFAPEVSESGELLFRGPRWGGGCVLCV